MDTFDLLSSGSVPILLTNSEVFIPHCVDADGGLAKLGQEIFEGKVGMELDIVLDREVLAQIFEVLKQFPVILTPTSSDDDKPRLPPVLLAQDLSQLEHRLDLEDVIFLRSELAQTENPHLTSSSILVPGNVLKMCCVTGREHLE